MVGWHLQLNGHEFEQGPGDGEKQGSLVCCSPRGHRVRHSLTTEQQRFGLQTIDAVLHLEFSSLTLRRKSFFFFFLLLVYETLETSFLRSLPVHCNQYSLYFTD